MAPAAGRESGRPAGGVRTVPVPRPLPLRAAYWPAGQGSRVTPNHCLPEVRRAPKGVSGAQPRERARAPAQRLCPPRDPKQSMRWLQERPGQRPLRLPAAGRGPGHVPMYPGVFCPLPSCVSPCRTPGLRDPLVLRRPHPLLSLEEFQPPSVLPCCPPAATSSHPASSYI